MNFVDPNAELLKATDWLKGPKSGDLEAEDLRRRHVARLQLAAAPKAWLKHTELQPKEAT